ncbi:hypothetical protein H7I76_26820 [Mycolicibacterium vaccae]|nr:hypothetical protein [Mycolicibacterium vaccae]
MGTAIRHSEPASRREVGAMELLDLQLINERDGRDSLPYPFMLTRPTRFEFVDDVAPYAAQLPDRLRSGDLSTFARVSGCVAACRRHSCRSRPVHPSRHTEYPRTGFSHRAGRLPAGATARGGRPGCVHDLAVELGAAVAAAMGLQDPGRHPRIVIPEYVPIRPAIVDDDVVVAHHEVVADPGVKVSVSQLSAYAKVQSNWRPAREWGIDSGKESLTWIRVKDDGDYLGAPDRSSGIPLTAALLSERIDGLIAADIEMLREVSGEP